MCLEGDCRPAMGGYRLVVLVALLLAPVAAAGPEDVILRPVTPTECASTWSGSASSTGVASSTDGGAGVEAAALGRSAGLGVDTDACLDDEAGEKSAEQIHATVQALRAEVEGRLP